MRVLTVSIAADAWSACPLDSAMPNPRVHPLRTGVEEAVLCKTHVSSMERWLHTLHGIAAVSLGRTPVGERTPRET